MLGYGIAVIIIIILAILWQIFTKGGKILTILGIGGWSSPFNIGLIVALILILIYLAHRLRR
ncbi:MAG: hypothetical protein QW693_00625 [Candidatus Bathyarchaeia archaeon]